VYRMSLPMRTSYRPLYGVSLTESTLTFMPRRGSISFLIGRCWRGLGADAGRHQDGQRQQSDLLFLITSPVND
jgi:hypothetical protein